MKSQTPATATDTDTSSQMSAHMTMRAVVQDNYGEDPGEVYAGLTRGHPRPAPPSPVTASDVPVLGHHPTSLSTRELVSVR